MTKHTRDSVAGIAKIKGIIEKKRVLTQNSELLRHPLLHDLVLAYVGHLALKHSTLVN